MNYNEFLIQVRDGVKELMEKGTCVKVQKILKNNGKEMEALTIIVEGSNVSPTICLEPFYTEYETGKSLGEIIQEIYILYCENEKQLHFDFDIFSEYEHVRDRIVFKLINTKANRKLLRDVPHIPFLDLSIVFYCIFDNEYMGTATAMIHNIHMNMWEVTKEQLYEAAKENTPKLLGCELREMNDLLHEILLSDIRKTVCENSDGYDHEEEVVDADEVAASLMKNMETMRQQISMYVLTNKRRVNGAASILYGDLIRDFANILKQDLFIIPSSVHEVILVPAEDTIETQELNEMVRSVNATDLKEIDILSDHVYYYSRQTDKISI